MSGTKLLAALALAACQPAAAPVASMPSAGPWLPKPAIEPLHVEPPPGCHWITSRAELRREQERELGVECAPGAEHDDMDRNGCAMVREQLDDADKDHGGPVELHWRCGSDATASDEVGSANEDPPLRQ